MATQDGSILLEVPNVAFMDLSSRLGAVPISRSQRLYVTGRHIVGLYLAARQAYYLVL